jgi:hypothetical protein
MNVFEKVHALSLPPEQYVVVGSCVLVALQLIEDTSDIDMAVAPKIFDFYKAAGWQQTAGPGKVLLGHDVYEIGVGFGQWSLRQLQEDSMTIDRIPFMSLEKLYLWKSRSGRQKDLPHLRLMEQYLEQQS